MKIYGKPASRRSRATLTRSLTFLLLLGMIYSVVLDSAHNHGSMSSTIEASQSTVSTPVTSVSADVSRESGSNGDGCLICLFHQQLFNSIVHAPAFIVRPSVQSVSTTTVTLYYHSDPIVKTSVARLSGRAPPLA